MGHVFEFHGEVRGGECHAGQVCGLEMVDRIKVMINLLGD
jgi:hypothetical protein